MTRSINHPNVVRLIDFRETLYNYILVLEFMSGGELYATLFDQVCFPEDVCRDVICQIAKALEYLHEERGIVHRDIKLENILFNSIQSCGTLRPVSPSKDEQVTADPDAGRNIGIVKVADFGLSKVVFNATTLTPCGTVGYTAPEILTDGKYSKAVDVWALGCVLYTMLCGFPPFFDDSPKGLADKVSGGVYAFLSPWWDSISIESKDLITHLLEINPVKRYTIKEFFKHPWVRRETFSQSYVPPQKLLEAMPGFIPDPSAPEVLHPETECAFLPEYNFVTGGSPGSPMHDAVDSLLAKSLKTKIPKVSRVPSCPNYLSKKSFSFRAEEPKSKLPPESVSPDIATTSAKEPRCKRQDREARAKYPLPFELCSKDIVAAPLSIIQGMCDDMNRNVLQFVKVYNGNGAVSVANSARAPQRSPSAYNGAIAPHPEGTKAGNGIIPNSKLDSPVHDVVPSPDNDRVPVTEVKILHGLKRNVKNFKLDIELSPLYNRRKCVRMGILARR